MCECVCVYLLRLQPEGLVSDLTGTLLLSDCDSVFLLRDRGAATFSPPCRCGCALASVCSWLRGAFCHLLLALEPSAAPRRSGSRSSLTEQNPSCWKSGRQRWCQHGCEDWRLVFVFVFIFFCFLFFPICPCVLGSDTVCSSYAHSAHSAHSAADENH